MALDSITSTPGMSGTQRIMDAFSQGTATGRIPSRRYLDQLIQSELDAAANNSIKQRAFAEQVRMNEQNQRNFDTQQQNAMDTAAANRSSGMVGSATNLAATAAMTYLLKPSAPPPTTPAAPGETGVVRSVVNGVKDFVSPSTPQVTPGPTGTPQFVPNPSLTPAPAAPPVSTTGVPPAPAAPVSATGVPATTVAPAAEAFTPAPAIATGETLAPMTGAGATSTGATTSGIGGTYGANGATPLIEGANVSTGAYELGGTVGSQGATGLAGGAGATVGSIAGGVASAMPYYAAWKIGMPILRESIMQKGTESAFGIKPDSGNYFAQMNEQAGRGTGIWEQIYHVNTGKDLPDAVNIITDPAGALVEFLDSLF